MASRRFLKVTGSVMHVPTSRNVQTEIPSVWCAPSPEVSGIASACTNAGLTHVDGRGSHIVAVLSRLATFQQVP